MMDEDDLFRERVSYGLLTFYGERFRPGQLVRVNGWAAGRLLIIKEDRIYIKKVGWIPIKTIWSIEHIKHMG